MAQKPKGLAACPFCGTTEFVNIHRELDSEGGTSAHRFVVKCGQDDCSIVSGPAASSEQGAVTSWNNRPLQPDLHDRIAKLERAVGGPQECHFELGNPIQ